MRSTSLGAALALLVLGCGLENDATGPLEPGVHQPDFAGLPAPGLAAAPISGWSSRAPMPTGRYFHAAAAVNGIIYVVGGRLSNSSRAQTGDAASPDAHTAT